MRILVSGSTGFVGTALVAKLSRRGHFVARLVRRDTPDRRALAGQSAPQVRWDPLVGEFDADAPDGMDALVHLAGASIAGGRWNTARKELLRTSRIDATRHLIAALAKLRRPPRVIVAASAIGFYGNRGEETLTETSAPGSDFLAQLCLEWEAEAARGAEFGARVVHARFGIILAKHGGALPRIAAPIKMGVGGRLGDGKQWMSWATLEETVRMLEFAIGNAALAGPVNVVTPNPARNEEFTKALARTLRRPTLFPAPAFALRLAFGEMADGLLLASQRVVPSKLLAAGYRFEEADLDGALASVYRS